MKNIFIYILLLVSALLLATACKKDEPEFLTITDARDGQLYQVVKINQRYWMAENLNYEIEDSWCYDNASVNCDVFGRLYSWEAALQACPSGWRLPTDKEWLEMIEYFDPNFNQVSSSASYEALINGQNSGFNVLLGGFRPDHGYSANLGYHGYFWSATEKSAEEAWFYDFYQNHRRMYRYFTPKSWGFSCRCIQE